MCLALMHELHSFLLIYMMECCQLCFYCTLVVLAGGHHAVHFIIARSVDVMGAGVEEGEVVADLGADYRHQRVEIRFTLEQLVAICLRIVVLIEQLGKQQVEVMSIKGIEAVDGVVCVEVLQLDKSAVGLAPQQAIDGGHRGIGSMHGSLRFGTR